MQCGTTATNKFYVNQDKRAEQNKVLRESGKAVSKGLHDQYENKLNFNKKRLVEDADQRERILARMKEEDEAVKQEKAEKKRLLQ